MNGSARADAPSERRAARDSERTVRRAVRAVFLDRDGVLNRCEVRGGKPYAPRRLEEFRLLPGTAAALRTLKQAGFLLVVVTNQPDIGNGKVSPDVVESMHRRLREKLPVDDIRMCPHRQTDGCDCRKPRPGMLLSAAKEWNISLRDSFMIGDRWSDVVAGRGAGCYTLFLDRHYEETPQIQADAVSVSLAHAVQQVLAVTQEIHAKTRP